MLTDDRAVKFGFKPGQYRFLTRSINPEFTLAGRLRVEPHRQRYLTISMGSARTLSVSMTSVGEQLLWFKFRRFGLKSASSEIGLRFGKQLLPGKSSTNLSLHILLLFLDIRVHGWISNVNDQSATTSPRNKDSHCKLRGCNPIR